MIAQASAKLDGKGKFVEDMVAVRHLNEFTVKAPEEIRIYGCFTTSGSFGCSFIDSIP